MSDKLRVITDTPAPKPAESENPITQVPGVKSVTDFLKDDSPLMQVIEKIPFLAPLKDMIGGLKNFLEKIGVQLGDLKNEVEQSKVAQTISQAPEKLSNFISGNDNSKEKESKLKPKGKFMEDAITYAKRVQEKYNIPWQVTYGQAAIETGRGKSAPNNNYFGIKGQNNVKLTTKEYINGQWITIKDSFRGYESMEDSFMGYGEFLTKNPRYKNAFKYSDNPERFLQEVKKAGYATDPKYVAKVKKIWEKDGIELA